MTKNLFLLFVLYFFVVQAAIIGFLTGDIVYYQLAGINAIAIFLISLLYSLFTGNSEKKQTKKKEPSKEEPKPTTKPQEHTTIQPEATEKIEIAEKITVQKIVQPIPNTRKKAPRKTKAYGQWRLFLITIIIAALLNYTAGEFLTYRSPLLALVIGFIIFIIIGKILDLNGFSSIIKLPTTRIYYLLILLGVGYAGIYSSGKEALIEPYIPELRGSGDYEIQTPKTETLGTKNNPDYIFEETGEVLSGTNISEVQLSGTTLSGAQLSGTTLSGGTTTTGEKSNLTGTTTTGAETQTPTETKNVTMMDALKHVITANNIPLSTKTDLTFSNVSKSNENYTYYKTAYEKRMIGKNTDPFKQISCETYIVIKGLAENRTIGNYNDIKDAYRKKAEELGKLNGCKK
jgi:hypothetical protein